MLNTILLSINLGTTHFVSFADVIMRGIFLPLAGFIAVAGIIKTSGEMKYIDYSEDFIEYEDDFCASEEDYGEENIIVFRDFDENKKCG